MGLTILILLVFKIIERRIADLRAGIGIRRGKVMWEMFWNPTVHNAQPTTSVDYNSVLTF